MEMFLLRSKAYVIARPAGLHYYHYVSPSVHKQLVGLLKNYRTTCYILIKCCLQMYVNIIKPLACVTAIFDGRGIAKNHFGRLGSFSKNDHNS